MKRIFFVGLLASFAAVTGCPQFGDVCDYSACGDGATVQDASPDISSPDTSTDATTDRDPPPPGCDTPNDPLKNPEKCLVDSFGVFVSPSGDDANAGTKDKPVKTIGKALSMGRGRVVVCEGTYTESLEIKADVELYSGVTCDFAKAGGKAKLVASKPEYAVSIGKVTASLSDLDISGIPGTASSPNSIGVWVVDATKLTLRNVSVAAKAGFKGDDGTPGTTGAYAAGNGNGNPADMNAAGAQKVCTCSSGGTSAGGAGGAANSNGQNGADPIPANPAGNDGVGGLGGVSCNPSGAGRNGADRVDIAAASKLTSPRYDWRE
jgi:hypothetical protein